MAFTGKDFYQVVEPLLQEMRMDDNAIEKEIQKKGLTAPRVTPELVESVIISEHYFTAGDGVYGVAARGDKDFEGTMPTPLNLLTFCVLVLKNGFTVTGESACASPENFNAEIGCKIARQHAKDKIWALEAYLLRQYLWIESQKP